MRFRSFLALGCVVGGVSLLAAPALAQEHEYVGTKNCKKCHIKEWRSWSQTDMANAYETLKPGVKAEEKKAHGLDPNKDYTTDAKCLRCHTTGYGKKGGFVDLASTPELVGGSCEVCHGPGGTYTQDGYMTNDNKEYKRSELVAVGMVEKVSEKQCLGCHNSESPTVGDDYVFDFAEQVKKTHEKFPLKYKHD